MKKKIVTIAEAAILGGKATLKLYGREHYVKMVEKRWSNARKAKKQLT